MARLTIPDELIYADFTVTTSRTVFPFSFAIFSKDDLRVRVNGLQLAQSDFTLSGALLEGGGYQGGSITLNSPVSNADVRIWRRITPQRPSNFASTASVPVRSVDMEFNKLAALAQDVGLALQDVEAGVVDPQVLADVVETATTNKRDRGDVPLVIDLLADAGDGVTDCSSTLARTDVDFITLPPGDYRVTISCTIARPIYFAPGSKMTIDAGVTVTFSGRGQVTSDCRRQVFYGTGAVLGLRFVDETWFVGDKIYALDRDYITNDVTTPLGLLGPNADAELQRAANACRQNAKYQCHSGVLSLSGDVSIAFNDQVEIRGDLRTSLYMWTSLKTNGFALNQQRSKISGVWFRKYAMDQFATEGVGIYINASQPFVDNIMVSGAFIGIQQVNHAGGFFDSLEIYSAKSAAFSLVNVNDTVLKGFLFNGGNELGSFTSPSAGWTSVNNGDVITGGTSGAKFVVGHVTPVGKLSISKFYQNAQQPVFGEVFTNERTGATATMSGYEVPHSEAGLKLEQTGFSVSNFTEGTFVSSGDIINGFRSLLILGSGTGYREGPSFNTFTSVYFDSALGEGVKLDRTDGVTFTACWVSARLRGFNIDNGRSISWNGCDIRDSAGDAGYITGPASSNIEFVSCRVMDNLSGVPGTAGSQISVNHDFAGHLGVYGGRWGRSTAARHMTDTAILFLPNGGLPGATNAHFTWVGGECRGFRVFPIGNLTGVANYWVQGVLGARLKARGTGTIPTTALNTTFAHGMPLTPDKNLVRIGVNSVNSYGGGAALVASAADATNLTVGLYDKDGTAFAATKNVNFWWEVDQSYNAIN